MGELVRVTLFVHVCRLADVIVIWFVRVTLYAIQTIAVLSGIAALVSGIAAVVSGIAAAIVSGIAAAIVSGIAAAVVSGIAAVRVNLLIFVPSTFVPLFNSVPSTFVHRFIFD